MSYLRHLDRLLREVWSVARANRAWWMVPLELVLLVPAALINSGQVAAPFIYTLF